MKDITIDILTEKGFKDVLKERGCPNELKELGGLYSYYIDNYTINIYYNNLTLNPFETNWECQIYRINNNSEIDYLLVTANIQTVEQFNKLMEVFNIDFEL